MMEIPTQRLPKALFFVFVVLLNMFIPLSTDMYLPALPEMTNQLGGTEGLVNLTLSGFFIFFAVGALAWGPLSDRFGRKSLLIGLIVVYILSSLTCARSTGILMLIVSRCIQGLVAGGLSTVAMAIIKDVFVGDVRVRMLALMQAAGGVAPMVAPSIGTVVMRFSSWRMVFVVLAFIGLLALILAIFFSETHERDRLSAVSLPGMVRQLGRVLVRPVVGWPILIFSLGGLAFMGYLSASAFIYIGQFHLSREQYALFFSGNALISMLSPLLYAKWGLRLNRRLFANGVFMLTMAMGVCLIWLGSLSPWVFFGFFAVCSVLITAMRPFSTNLVFDQHSGDNGTISALLSTTNMLIGSLGIMLASAAVSNRVVLLGTLISGSAIVSLVGWQLLLHSRVRLVGVGASPRTG